MRSFRRWSSLAALYGVLAAADVKSFESKEGSFGSETLQLHDVTKESETRKIVAMRLQTDRGEIDARYHASSSGAVDLKA